LFFCFFFFQDDRARRPNPEFRQDAGRSRRKISRQAVRRHRAARRAAGLLRKWSTCIGVHDRAAPTKTSSRIRWPPRRSLARQPRNRGRRKSGTRSVQDSDQSISRSHTDILVIGKLRDALATLVPHATRSTILTNTTPQTPPPTPKPSPQHHTLTTQPPPPPPHPPHTCEAITASALRNLMIRIAGRSRRNSIPPGKFFPRPSAIKSCPRWTAEWCPAPATCSGTHSASAARNISALAINLYGQSCRTSRLDFVIGEIKASNLPPGVPVASN